MYKQKIKYYGTYLYQEGINRFSLNHITNACGLTRFHILPMITLILIGERPN